MAGISELKVKFPNGQLDTPSTVSFNPLLKAHLGKNNQR